MYISGDYLKKNPTWHIEDSPWKAKQIIKMMKRNNIVPETICEVGCGAGEILRQLQQNMNKECKFWGYEISPQAFELCQKRANEKLTFKLIDFLEERDVYYDLILLIDLIEHLEDYFSFLREVRPKSKYKILHVPLELSIKTMLRNKSIFVTRKLYGHIHYFTKELVIQVLLEAGYEVLDYFYTNMGMEQPAKSYRDKLTRLIRRTFFTVNKDLCVRIIGGYSIMVLAR